MKIMGFGKSEKVDHFVTKEMLDTSARRRLQKFLEDIEIAIFGANREVIHKAIPELDRERFMAFAVRVAEARARYAKTALEIVARSPVPSAEDIGRLKAAREAHDELLQAFEATQRLISRGYTNIQSHPPIQR